MAPTRVLHVNLSPGGLGRYGVLFAAALEKRNDIEVLSVFDPQLLESQLLRSIATDLRKVEVPFGTGAQKANAVLALRRILKTWKPDLVHDTAGSGRALALLVLERVVRNSRLVVTEHDPLPHTGMGTSLSSRLARMRFRHRMDHVFVHGPLGKKDLVRQGVSPSKVTVIRHGQLAPLFDQAPSADSRREENTVLFFGALRPNKGVALLLPVADKIHRGFPNVRFVVAGSPKVARDLEKSGWVAELRNLLDEMRRRPYFEIHDRFIADEEVATFFRGASITLLPYLDATQSGVAMIAMPLGSVVVATRVGDLPYTIQDGWTGFLADPNVDSIVEKLSYVLSHPNELEEVRDRAKAWAEGECGWEKISSEAVKVYLSLCRGAIPER